MVGVADSNATHQVENSLAMCEPYKLVVGEARLRSRTGPRVKVVVVHVARSEDLESRMEHADGWMTRQ